MKSQSAMEYLMTYGWAVLAIAIVLIALAELGIFNGANVTPHSTAGACQAIHSAAGSSLAGQCNSAQPEFVAQFNGATSYVQINDAPYLRIGNPDFTFYAWINPLSLSTCSSDNCIIFNKENSYEWALSSNGQLCWAIDNSVPGWAWVCTSIYLPVGKFASVALTYNGVDAVAYLNGVASAPTSATGDVGTGGFQPLKIGARGGSGGTGSLFNGEISNVQIYNSSLSQSEVASLYQEGIGGVPVDPTHIVGWWPLNGNAQDYSGNNDQGTAASISYNASWSAEYTLS